MSKQNLNVELREETGKGVCRRLRSAGRVPAVVYGKGIEPVSISLDTRQFSEAIAGAGGRNHILTLVGGGSLDGQTVIVCDMLQDSIKRTPRHVDLHRISLSDKVKVHVPVRLVGTAAGAKAGGMVDFAMHELEVECLPVHIPDYISVDVTELTIGHSIHVGEIPAPVGIAILGDPKAAVISILGRKSAEAEEAPAA